MADTAPGESTNAGDEGVAGNAGAAVAEASPYQVSVDDAGPATKRVSVEVPAEHIATKLAGQFKELRREAAVPGFRPGHAPQKLIERKFQNEVREQVRRAIINESYEQAVKDQGLKVLGDPEFDDPNAVKELPAEGASLKYSFQVEVQPQITLPALEGMKVKRPKIGVEEENVDQAMQNLREQQGRLVAVEDRGVQAKDHLIADVKLKLGEEMVAEQSDVQLVARPGRIQGVDVVDLDKQLEGAKPGETRTIMVSVPDSHIDPRIRGKQLAVEIKVKEIKRLEEAVIDNAFLDDLGFTNEKELRDALRDQMVERVTADVQQALREQVHRMLLEQVQLDLPAKLSERQVKRVSARRSVDLLMRGVPADQIDPNSAAMQEASREEALRDLKLFFILQKLAEDLGVDVDEGELNGRIAYIAAQRDQRPEQLKQEMSKDGSMLQLYIRLREHKAVDKLLEKAQIEEVDLQG